jgi:hypothetical protein
VKLISWLVFIILAAMFGFAVWHFRRQAAERERAAAERLANFMAQSLPAAQPAVQPTAPATEADGSQKLLMEAASKAGQAGEAALSIQLYARLLARYPDTSFAGLARAAVEEQKKKLARS